MNNELGLKLCEVGPNSERTIEIDTGPEAELPITIGRSPDANIIIGILGRNVYVPHPNPIKRQAGEKVQISQLISRVQATIFRDEIGRIRIRDGNGNASQYGLREGATDKLLRRPWLLSPGAFVKLTPEGNGYRCWVEWSAPSCDADTPTIGFSAWHNENLQEELKEQASAIKALNTALEDLQTTSTETDKRQDLKIRFTEKKLARLIIVGAIELSILAVSLGITSEQMQEILQIVTMVATVLGSGVILTHKGKPG
ncbi:MAG: FHA domain-containing protein [Cyanobacteria bacterium P01_F01_bin.13]